MLRKFTFLALATTLAFVSLSSKANAWGAYHVGYTHVGYGGYHHYGYTSVHGPYGAYGAHYGSSGENSSYVGGVHVYGTGGYAGHGYPFGGYGSATNAYRAGYYRRW